MNSIVSIDWLLENRDNPNLVVLDVRLKPNSEEVDQHQIKGACSVNMKGTYFSNPDDPFPNAFPLAENFQEGIRKLGIDEETLVVVYDNQGIFSAPRAWWLFRTFGHENVAVLNGGLPEWLERGLDVEPYEKENYPATQSQYSMIPNMSRVKFYDFMKQNVESSEACIIDARSPERFNGEVDEPRPGLMRGHIPKASNLHYKELLDERNWSFLPKDQLKEKFEPYVDENRPIVFSCGSGITACILLLASEYALENEKWIYDGSWTEWGTLENPEL